jgi:glycerophosphoryl diester phosphodiesterase
MVSAKKKAPAIIAGAFRLPTVMGHRGAAGLAPENTLAGFRAAAATGVTAVELDVYLTKDSIPVLSHDDDLSRMAGWAQRVTRSTLADLESVDVGARFDPKFRGERLPTLAAALGVIAELGLGVNIEIKRHRTDPRRVVDAIAAVLADCWPNSATTAMVSSFGTGFVAASRDLMPHIPRALIANHLPVRAVRVCARLGCVSMHLRHDAISARRVARFHDAGLQVGTYKVSDASEAFKMWSAGVDCIITDRPDLILAAHAAAPGHP